MFNTGFTFFTTFFGVYLRNNFDFNSSKIGDYFAVVGLFIAFSQAVLVARVAKKFVDFKVLRVSLFGNATMMLIYFAIPTSASTMWLYVVVPFFTAFNGLTMANMSSLVSRSAEMGQQGQAMGIYSSIQSLAQVPASILVGYIATTITSSQPLVVSSACIAVGGILFVTLFRPRYVSNVVEHAHGGAPAH
jgi:DHA1 family tetracycline resistance protein-like MFS transporter